MKEHRTRYMQVFKLQRRNSTWIRNLDLRKSEREREKKEIRVWEQKLESLGGEIERQSEGAKGGRGNKKREAKAITKFFVEFESFLRHSISLSLFVIWDHFLDRERGEREKTWGSCFGSESTCCYGDCGARSISVV